MKIFFAFYSFLWTIVLPFLKNKPRIQDGLEERFVRVEYAKAEENKKNILLYAASGGEAFLACTFLKKNFEEHCTYYAFSWTKEGVNAFRNFANKNPYIRLFAYYAPFDKPKFIAKAIEEISPTHCYILETEIWFGLLYACKKHAVSFSFVNARMTEKTFKNLSYFKWLFRKFQPKEVFALSQDDKERFTKLFSLEVNDDRIKIQENLKFDQARELLEEKQNEEIQLSLPVLLFASVRQEEEEDILFCIDEIKKTSQDICIIVCPKHIERSVFWKEKLKDTNAIDALLATENALDMSNLQAHIDNGSNTFIWNTFGYLKKLYACADIVFVGGSLAPLGGQNFLEPLVQGTIPYTGKNLKNFLWVFEKEPSLRELSLINEVENKEELSQKINKELVLASNNLEEKRAEKKEISEKFKKWLN